MIDETKINEIAALKRITPQNAEKEYFQELILYSLYRLVGKEIIFKGGTCLYKIYKLNRFSEDLDFDTQKSLDVKELIRKALYNIKLVGIVGTVKYFDEYENAVNIGINFNGPLYDGSKETVCFLLLNFSLRQKASLPPKLEKINSLYREFPDFDVFVMDLNEILAEKIAAVHSRNKPRDVYDVWYLLKRLNVHLDMSLAKKKLKRQFKKQEFLAKVQEKEKYWKGELGKLIVGQLPDFNQVKNDIEALAC